MWSFNCYSIIVLNTSILNMFPRQRKTQFAYLKCQQPTGFLVFFFVFFVLSALLSLAYRIKTEFHFISTSNCKNYRAAKSTIVLLLNSTRSWSRMNFVSGFSLIYWSFFFVMDFSLWNTIFIIFFSSFFTISLFKVLSIPFPLFNVSNVLDK